MAFFNSKEIDLLISRFESRTLPKEEWTHQAHLVVAICYCDAYSQDEALNRVRQNIRNYNEAVGTPNTDTSGYHETMTRFWIWTAGKFLESHQFSSLEEACNHFVDSKYAAREYPFEYYSRAHLFSAKARHHWVEPDLTKMNELR